MSKSVKKSFLRGFALATLASVLVVIQAESSQAQWATNNGNINNTNPGAVGIGTTDPSQGAKVGSKFTVVTADDTATAIATGNGINPRFALNNNGNGSWTMFDYVGNAWHSGITQHSGNVGIGTTAPAFLLDVSGSTNKPFRVRHSGGLEYISASLLTGTYGATTAVSLANNRLIVEGNGHTGGNDTIIRRFVNSLHFSPSDHPDLPGVFGVWQVGGTYGLAVDQKANGNVGIGAAPSTAKLTVGGDLNATGTITGGNITAKYQDVAEWVPSKQKLAAGTVVILDTGFNNHVAASSTPYDTRVAGVISAQPGLSLGEAGEGKVLVATTGRVKVKVDATRAPIKIGDLLVTSEVAGVAMRSQPLELSGVQLHRPGTLIGKALEPLDKGTGEILVLLSLQ